MNVLGGETSSERWSMLGGAMGAGVSGMSGMSGELSMGAMSTMSTMSAMSGHGAPSRQDVPDLIGFTGLPLPELGPLDLEMLADPSSGIDLATDDAFRLALDRP